MEPKSKKTMKTIQNNKVVVNKNDHYYQKLLATSERLIEYPSSYREFSLLISESFMIAGKVQDKLDYAIWSSGVVMLINSITLSIIQEKYHGPLQSM